MTPEQYGILLANYRAEIDRYMTEIRACRDRIQDYRDELLELTYGDTSREAAAKAIAKARQLPR